MRVSQYLIHSARGAEAVYVYLVGIRFRCRFSHTQINQRITLSIGTAWHCGCAVRWLWLCGGCGCAVVVAVRWLPLSDGSGSSIS